MSKISFLSLCVLGDEEVISYMKNFNITTYEDFAPMFTGELFDPDEWAALFSKAGAQFVLMFLPHKSIY